MVRKETKKLGETFLHSEANTRIYFFWHQIREDLSNLYRLTTWQECLDAAQKFPEIAKIDPAMLDSIFKLYRSSSRDSLVSTQQATQVLQAGIFGHIIARISKAARGKEVSVGLHLFDQKDQVTLAYHVLALSLQICENHVFEQDDAQSTEKLFLEVFRFIDELIPTDQEYWNPGEQLFKLRMHDDLYAELLVLLADEQHAGQEATQALRAIFLQHGILPDNDFVDRNLDIFLSLTGYYGPAPSLQVLAVEHKISESRISKIALDIRGSLESLLREQKRIRFLRQSYKQADNKVWAFSPVSRLNLPSVMSYPLFASIPGQTFSDLIAISPVNLEKGLAEKSSSRVAAFFMQELKINLEVLLGDMDLSNSHQEIRKWLRKLRVSKKKLSLDFPLFKVPGISRSLEFALTNGRIFTLVELFYEGKIKDLLFCVNRPHLAENLLRVLASIETGEYGVMETTLWLRSNRPDYLEKIKTIKLALRRKYPTS